VEDSTEIDLDAVATMSAKIHIRQRSHGDGEFTAAWAWIGHCGSIVFPDAGSGGAVRLGGHGENTGTGGGWPH
jgi:hypothetical protein